MLQQTQVQTVIPYFERFVERFPDLNALAAVSLDDVLAHWSGLGYYSRARNLHRCAQLCAERGELPSTIDALMALPGIGRSTAGAILSQADGLPHAILDGNVRRVLVRRHCIDGDPRSPANDARLWRLAEAQLPTERLADYTQACMDLGATVCVRSKPRCDVCPVSDDCAARLRGVVDAYPARKLGKPRPERQRAFLLIVDTEQRIALQRRPASGIWGGLYALPEAESIDELTASMGGVVAGAEPLCQHRHEFTHFVLLMDVWRASAVGVTVADGGLQFFACDQALSLGLPQPIRQIIATEFADSAAIRNPQRKSNRVVGS